MMYIPALGIALMLPLACNTGQTKTSKQTTDSVASLDLPTGAIVPIAEDQGTRLDFSSSPETRQGAGRLEVIGNMAMHWSGDGTIAWAIDVPEAGEYEVRVSYAALKDGAQFTARTTGSSTQTTVLKTKGMWWNQYDMSDIHKVDIDEEWLSNYSRITFPDPIELQAGTQALELAVSEMITDEIIDFRAVELTPVDAVQTREADIAQATAERSSTDWMVEAKYGLMFHWTDMTVNGDGSQLDYEDAVNAFDVEAFADLSEELGAGYVLFTLNHQYPHCPAPIPAWETIHPGWTTERDLVAELIAELSTRDIPLMLYVASHLLGQPDDIGEPRWLRAHRFSENSDLADDPHFDIVANNAALLEAIGERYGTGLAGFWLDGWDLIPEQYPHPDLQAVTQAAKAGNPDRIVSYNRWIFPTVNPWQDYWAGEVDSIEKSPDERYISFAAGQGLQLQSLIAMEDDWVFTQEGLQDGGPRMYKPRFTKRELVNFIERSTQAQGAVTINVAIHQDGVLGEDVHEVLAGVADEVR